MSSSKALVKVNTQALVSSTGGAMQGTFRDPGAITQRLQHAAENMNLVSPASACGAVPEACAVTMAAVLVDAREMKDGGEVYAIDGGKYGLGKSALDKIAAAAAISWTSQRLDDGSHPHYCHYRAVGHLKNFDGSERQIVAEKEMDLRDGSPQIEALLTRARNKLARWEREGKAKGWKRPAPPDGQIAELRQHILSHADTKARLRAIRSLGIRTSYTLEDLAKPFVVARLQYTGQTEDPELRRQLAVMHAQRMLGASSALYGSEGAAAGQATPSAVPLRLPPPPVSNVRPVDADDFDDEPAVAPASAGGAGRPPSDPPDSGGARSEPSGLVVPFGKEKGVPLTEASDDTLRWLAGIASKELADPEKTKWRRRNEALLAAISAEEQRRESPGDEVDGQWSDVGPGEWDEQQPPADEGY